MRQRWINVIAGITLTGFVGTAVGEMLDVEGSDALKVRRKMTCHSLTDGKVVYGTWEGRAYSRVPGEKDRHIFNVMGINTRHCSSAEDEERGQGYRSVSREVMVYMDPKTNEVLDTWENPWTGQTVKVLHVANDPVNMRAPSYEKDKDGNPIKMSLRVYGDIVASSSEVPLFYPNPLGGDYQNYVGGTYHAMEIFNTFYPRRALLNGRTKDLPDAHLGWSRVAQWLPWMEMGSKPGLMVFNTTGFSTHDKDEIPSRLMEVLEADYPEYLEPPPLGRSASQRNQLDGVQKVHRREKPKLGRSPHPSSPAPACGRGPG